MHFSRPSGQRLSWCRPWKRGAVGCFSKGYCSVTTFLNIVRNVTPNPATGSQSCSLRVLPSCGVVLLHGRDRAAGVERQGGGGAAHGTTGGHRRHGEPTGVALRDLLALAVL